MSRRCKRSGEYSTQAFAQLSLPGLDQSKWEGAGDKLRLLTPPHKILRRIHVTEACLVRTESTSYVLLPLGELCTTETA